MFSLDNQFSHNQTLEQALQITRHFLTSFATNEDFFEKMILTFGNDFDREEAQSLAQDWITGSFNKFPSIQIIDATQINGALGA
ncbi:hypothetical protein NIES4071_44070 [Calothrix sp. NIES-4071]|nr:hypothetical protein NIES4071_44070 [Calothrix sp. NIES-4071]BAZ58721.1 hypothetical protein NIES4105_44000 [Calothrix sp. NIES-4105]